MGQGQLGQLYSFKDFRGHVSSFQGLNNMTFLFCGNISNDTRFFSTCSSILPRLVV